MKSLLLFSFVLLVLPQSFAAADSVGVFYRPEKVVVAINEANPRGRLAGFMDSVAAAESFVWTSPDQDLHIQCGRSSLGASCTFRFLPSANVQTFQRGARGVITAANVAASDYEMKFQSSMMDRFNFEIRSGQFTFEATKRELTK